MRGGWKGIKRCKEPELLPKAGFFRSRVNAKMGKAKFRVCRGQVFRGKTGDQNSGETLGLGLNHRLLSRIAENRLVQRVGCACRPEN